MKPTKRAAIKLLIVMLAVVSMALPIHAAEGILVCQTRQTASITSIATPDPTGFLPNRRYATNQLSANWLNSAGSIVRNANWTDQPIGYFEPENFKTFAFRSKTCSRDMELDTWTRNGYVVLRYDTRTSRGIFFRLNLEVIGGQLEIGIVANAGESEFLQGDYYVLYSSTDLVHLAPGYANTPTDDHYFTFGVDGFDIYAKFNGIEFVRFKDYRAMASGSALIKANQHYGIRKTTLRHKLPSPLFSDYENNSLDLRDLGLREIEAHGSMIAGSNQLTLSSVPPVSFRQGDFIIVELGGEAGHGRRGTIGVGGTWPRKRYRSVAEMNADAHQPANTFAWLESDGSVWQWYEDSWIPREGSQYYTNRVFPLALRAKIVALTADGRTATLDRSAIASTSNASVYVDNYYVFYKLLRNPRYDGELNFPVSTDTNDLTQITPTDVTLVLPAGNYAVADTISWNSPSGWKLVGQGQSVSKIFSPKGVKSANINIYSTRVVVRDFSLQGNARDNGFGLNVTETTVPQGSAFPYGVNFVQTEDGTAADLTVSDVFQRAVGAAFSTNVWGKRITVRMPEGLRQYVQWMLQWSDSAGGGCEDCYVESPKLLGGFESFKSTGTRFLRPVGINATFALNDAGDFLIQDGTVRILAGSNKDNGWFSVHNPIVNVNTNIGNRYASAGGTIRNMTMIQEGFVGGTVDPNHDSLIGINVNAHNPNIVILGGLYSAPDYTPLSVMVGPLAVNSTAPNLVVDGMRVIGRPFPDWGNISLTNGIVKNCVAAQIRAAGPSVRIENCKTNPKY